MSHITPKDIKLLKREVPLKTNELQIVSGLGEWKSDPISTTKSSRRSGREQESSNEASSPDGNYPYVPDFQQEDMDEDLVLGEVESDTHIYVDPSQQRKHDNIWRDKISNKPRIVSQGDLRYDLGQSIVAILPFYGSTINGEFQMKTLSLVKGEIIDITSVPVDGRDIPREIMIRVTPEKKSNTWAKSLIARSMSEDSRGKIQTMVQSYTVKLDPEFSLRKCEIDELYARARSEGMLPYKYDLHFSSSAKENTQKKTRKKSKSNRSNPQIDIRYDVITISYRYIMGSLASCFRYLVDNKNFSEDSCELSDFNEPLKRFNLWSGASVVYFDPNPIKSRGSFRNYSTSKSSFTVIDHLCLGPFDLRFVIKCLDEPRRILSITELTEFDIRGDYINNNYYCFHPVDKYVYDVVQPGLKSYERVMKILHSVFDPIQIYVVKKSLCDPEDIKSSVYEDPSGNIQYIPGKPGVVSQDWDLDDSDHASQSNSNNDRESTSKKYRSPENRRAEKADVARWDGDSTPAVTLKYSGISLTSYVKGLAYPEGNCPTQYNSYIFFHSKDYHDLVLDPANPQFLEFVCISDAHLLFRNPAPKDIIAAIPFVCNREQFKGKTNLKWFYPTDEFRLLHLYITTNGTHPHFQLTDDKSHRNYSGMSRNTIRTRKIFNNEYLSILDLFMFGISEKNPTLDSEFTQRFIHQFFWWEFIKQELHRDSNYSEMSKSDN